MSWLALAVLVVPFLTALATLAVGHRSDGAVIFQQWVLPFEVLSVLLLAALVGAIALSRRSELSGRGTPAGTTDADEPAGRGEG
jgi:NADH-quinone oxidoreductase subunit J